MDEDAQEAQATRSTLPSAAAAAMVLGSLVVAGLVTGARFSGLAEEAAALGGGGVVVDPAGNGPNGNGANGANGNGGNGGPGPDGHGEDPDPDGDGEDDPGPDGNGAEPRVALVDGDDGVVAEPSELALARGGTFRVGNDTAASGCGLDWGDDGVVLRDGDRALPPGGEVLLEAPPADTEVELTCLDLGTATPVVLVVVGSGEPDPATVTLPLVDPGSGLVLDPADVTVPVGTHLVVENTTETACPLAPAADLPEIVDGEADIAPGAATTFALPGEPADIKLICDVEGADSFVIRTRGTQ